jgi:predicted transcriptional regulator
MSKPLELRIWRKIHSIISKNPGIDVNKLAELLNMELSLVDGYLISMEKHNEITVLQDDNVKRFYTGDSSLVASQDRRASDTRIKLYSLILQNPGLHLSKIAELLEMSSPLAEYHLSYLEKNNFIMSVDDEKGYYKRFYIKYSKVGREDKKSLSLLRQEPLIKVVLLLIKHGTLKHKEIAEKLSIAPSTLSYHLSKLVDNGVIEVLYYGEEKGYSLKNEKEIIWIVRRYKLDQLVEGFKNTWSDLELS